MNWFWWRRPKFTVAEALQYKSIPYGTKDWDLFQFQNQLVQWACDLDFKYIKWAHVMRRKRNFEAIGEKLFFKFNQKYKHSFEAVKRDCELKENDNTL